MYTSEESHSSVEKAGIVLGVGQDNVVKIRTDSDFRMDVDALRHAISGDRAAGFVPFAVVATVGTTSVTAVDPVAGIADVCERERLWLHVDAAYGGAAAVLDSHRWIMAGCERAHSFLVNPHKWLFTPIDCSVLYCRREDLLKRAFSLTPAYLTTGEGETVRNLMDYGASLGRRFRGLQAVVRPAPSASTALASVSLHTSTWPRSCGLDRGGQGLRAPRADALFDRRVPPPLGRRYKRAHPRRGQRIREAFISHTNVRGRYALRVAIGNLRTTPEDVRSTWKLIKKSSAISS